VVPVAVRGDIVEFDSLFFSIDSERPTIHGLTRLLITNAFSRTYAGAPAQAALNQRIGLLLNCG
jgi:hypothetical protein